MARLIRLLLLASTAAAGEPPSAQIEGSCVAVRPLLLARLGHGKGGNQVSYRIDLPVRVEHTTAGDIMTMLHGELHDMGTPEIHSQLTLVERLLGHPVSVSLTNQPTGLCDKPTGWGAGGAASCLPLDKFDEIIGASVPCSIQTTRYYYAPWQHQRIVFLPGMTPERHNVWNTVCLLASAIAITAGLFIVCLVESRVTNSERFIRRARKHTVANVPSSYVSSVHEGSMIHTQGKLSGSDSFEDAEVGLDFSQMNRLCMKRKVEMYQWQQRTEKHGNKEVVKYYKVWLEDDVNSSGFAEAREHRNPPRSLQLYSKKFTRPEARIGCFLLPPAAFTTIFRHSNDWFRKVHLPTAATLRMLTETSHFVGKDGDVYIPKAAFSGIRGAYEPSIGDLRVSYERADIPAHDATVIGVQTGDGLRGYSAADAGLDPTRDWYTKCRWYDGGFLVVKPTPCDVDSTYGEPLSELRGDRIKGYLLATTALGLGVRMALWSSSWMALWSTSSRLSRVLASLDPSCSTAASTPHSSSCRLCC